MVTTTPPSSATRNLRAVVFSNFPGQLFEKSLRPRFERYGIDIVKVANLDKSKSTSVEGADIIVAMIELMSAGQRNAAKDLAKHTGKYFVGLPNKGDWGKYLSHFPRPPRLTPVPNKQQAPPSTPRPLPEAPEPPEPSLQDLKETLELYEMETEKLQEAKTTLEATLKERETALLNHAANVEKLRKENQTLEERLAEQTRIRGELEVGFTNLRKHTDGLERQLEAAKRVSNDSPNDSSPAMRAVNTRLKGRVSALEQQLNTAVSEMQDAKIRADRLEEQLRTASRSNTQIALAKELLLDWSRAIKMVQSGDARGYKKLLEVAAQHGLDIPTVLSIIQ